MMKTKLLIVLALLCVMGLDGVVVAGAAGSNSSPAFKADGVAQTQRRRKKRRARRVRKARSYAIKAAPESPPPPPPATQTAVEPEPQPEAMPKTGVSTPNQEFPNVAAPPPPPAADPQDAPGRGREPAPSKSGPRIKPPTVQIKPPTR
ncbi:MAG TPA: hypothetical protein VJ715_16330 [Pyrinomonadaceae bacterium]|nr:hypothetical protein [Pyrinomonadaceae bacterium]